MPFQFNAGERVLAEKTGSKLRRSHRGLCAQNWIKIFGRFLSVKAERRAVKLYSLDTVSLRPATTARATILTRAWT